MDLKEKASVYAVRNIAAKVIEEGLKNDAAEVKAQLLDEYERTGQDRVEVRFGRLKAHVTLKSGRETLHGVGPEFVEFMRDKGMTHEVVDPEWKDCVVNVGGQVIWAETGEVVPGARVERGAASIAVTGVKVTERLEFLEAARADGLFGGELPLLGGER